MCLASPESPPPPAHAACDPRAGGRKARCWAALWHQDRSKERGLQLDSPLDAFPLDAFGDRRYSIDPLLLGLVGSTLGHGPRFLSYCRSEGIRRSVLAFFELIREAEQIEKPSLLPLAPLPNMDASANTYTHKVTHKITHTDTLGAVDAHRPNQDDFGLSHSPINQLNTTHQSHA